MHAATGGYMKEEHGCSVRPGWTGQHQRPSVAGNGNELGSGARMKAAPA